MNYEKKEITFESDGLELYGTLLTPKMKKFPVVILFPGSGPNNRDETVGPNHVFMDLAELFAENGIGTLRCDKRTLTYGKDPSKIEKIMSLEDEVITDSISACNYLRKSGFSEIYFLGHSLGAWCAPVVAGKVKLEGIIMLSAPGIPILDLMYTQTELQLSMHNVSENEKQLKLQKFRDILTKIKNREYPSNEPVFGAFAKYWYSFQDNDPREEIKKLRLPILIAKGDNDIQVFQKDFEVWKDLTNRMKNVKMKLFPKITHILSKCEEKSTGLEYYKPQHVDKELVLFLVDWIKNSKA